MRSSKNRINVNIESDKEFVPDSEELRGSGSDSEGEESSEEEPTTSDLDMIDDSDMQDVPSKRKRKMKKVVNKKALDVEKKKPQKRKQILQSEEEEKMDENGKTVKKRKPEQQLDPFSSLSREKVIESQITKASAADIKLFQEATSEEVKISARTLKQRSTAIGDGIEVRIINACFEEWIYSAFRLIRVGRNGKEDFVFELKRKLIKPLLEAVVELQNQNTNVDELVTGRKDIGGGVVVELGNHRNTVQKMVEGTIHSKTILQPRLIITRRCGGKSSVEFWMKASLLVNLVNVLKEIIAENDL